MQSFEPRTLGATGRTVGPLGLGSSYGLPGREVERAFDEGVSFFLWGSRRRADFGRGLREVARKDRARATIAVQTYARAGLDHPALRRQRPARPRHRLRRCPGPRVVERPPARAHRGARARPQGERQGALADHSRHERPTFATFAADARYDALMVRYNAAHPGSEREVFPHVAASPRRPRGRRLHGDALGLAARSAPHAPGRPHARRERLLPLRAEPPAGRRVPLRSRRRRPARRGPARGAPRPARRRRDGVDAPCGCQRPRGHEAPAPRRADEARRPHRVVEQQHLRSAPPTRDHRDRDRRGPASRPEGIARLTLRRPDAAHRCVPDRAPEAGPSRRPAHAHHQPDGSPCGPRLSGVLLDDSGWPDEVRAVVSDVTCEWSQGRLDALVAARLLGDYLRGLTRSLAAVVSGARVPPRPGGQPLRRDTLADV